VLEGNTNHPHKGEGVRRSAGVIRPWHAGRDAPGTWEAPKVPAGVKVAARYMDI
jgi:hypothetical protein